MAQAATEKDFNQDWWQREKRRRQNRVLIFLILLLALIGYFYWLSNYGRIGQVAAIDFDTKNHIAFINQDTQGKTQLYVVRADGTNLRRMTAEDDKSDKREPFWTRDAKSILYSSNRSDGRNDNRTSQIWIMGGDEIKQLTYGSGQKFAPFVNPDGKQTGFIVQGSVKTVYLNGKLVKQLLPLPTAGSINSDNPNELANSAEPKGPYLVANFAVDGVSVAAVQSISEEDNPMVNGEPVFGEQVIRVSTPDMERAAILCTGRETSFSWQSDVLKLAASFTGLERKDANGKKVLKSGVYLWDVSASKPRKPKQEFILKDPMPIFVALGYTLEPKNVSLAPDGKSVAFEVWRLKSEGNRELRGIIIMNTSIPGGVDTAEKADKVPITLPVIADGKPQMPRWSPDGSRLLYEVAKSNGTRDLWIVNADGTNPLNLTKNLQGDKSQAVWAPMNTP